jgi:hypothetical protein
LIRGVGDRIVKRDRHIVVECIDPSPIFAGTTIRRFALMRVERVGSLSLEGDC